MKKEVVLLPKERAERIFREPVQLIITQHMSND